MNKDLTVGKPIKVLWAFCLPLFASIIFQQLYNIADSLIAGKFIGENALAAVGNGYEVTLLFIAFAFGMNIGSSVIVSKYFGAKKFDDLKTAVSTTFIASIVLCLILMGAGFIFVEGLLNLIKTPAELMDDCLIYLNIYILGVPFVLFYNVANGIFSALGDSKTPFIFLAISSIANILVDILFVTAFKMGVSGVAWATFLCQGVSCILAVLFVFKRLSKIKSNGKYQKFNFRILSKIMIIAIPSILQQSFISVGNIVIQGVINNFGSLVIAGYSAAVKLNSLVITSLTTLGNGISNYTAQNIGAQKFERIHEGFKASIKIVYLITIPFILIYFFLGSYLIKFFIENPSELTITTGKQFLMIISPFYLVVSLKLIADGILRGSGLMNKFMIATFTDLILRVVLAIILAKFFGTIGIWCSWPIGWGVATILSIIFYKVTNFEEKFKIQE